MYKYSCNIIPNVPSLSFHQFKKTESTICCYGNPSIEVLPALKEVYGVNTYVTSINHLDQINTITTKTNKLEIDYHNISFIDTEKENTKSKENKYNINKIITQLKELYKLIETEKRTVFIQSAGGSIKTSIITYCLLRMSGEQRDDSLKKLTMLRGEKRNGFGDLRVEYAEKKIVPYLIKNELL